MIEIIGGYGLSVVIWLLIVIWIGLVGRSDLMSLMMRRIESVLSALNTFPAAIVDNKNYGD